MGAIVLAGGRGKRMGRDKASLPWGEGTLLAHVAGIVAGVTKPVVVVGGEHAPAGATLVADCWPGEGPLGGIVSGLEALPRGAHLAVGCDMPFLAPELLRLLLRQAERCDAAVPEVGGRLEPLCAAYQTRCVPLLREALDGGERSVQAALRRLNLRIVAEAELRRLDKSLASFRNINTRAEYDELSERTDGFAV